VFFFAVGILASTPIFNTFAMKHPVEGKAVTMKDYFAGDAKTHLTGMLGGFIWMGGMVIVLWEQVLPIRLSLMPLATQRLWWL